MSKSMLTESITSLIELSINNDEANAEEIMGALIQATELYAERLSCDLNYEQARSIALRLDVINDHLALVN